MIIDVKRYVKECREWKAQENEIKEEFEAGKLGQKLVYALILDLVNAVKVELARPITSDYANYGAINTLHQ